MTISNTKVTAESKIDAKVSVIVPVYNVEKYIEQCIRSIMSQSYGDIEIIVVNDGSSDSSSEIIKKLSKEDQRIICIDKPNGGVSSARNAGIDIARGDYLVFVDGDDYLAEEFVEYMLGLVQEDEVDFAFSKDCYRRKDEIDTPKEVIELLTPVEATALLLSPRVAVGCWNKIYSRKLIEVNNIRFSTSLFYGEGLNFITAVSQRAKKIAVSNRKIYYYRRNNLASATTKFNIENLKNGWIALDCIEKNLIISNPKIENMLMAHRCLYAFGAMIQIAYNKKRPLYAEDYELWKNYLEKNIIKNGRRFEIPWKFKLAMLIECIFPYLLVIRHAVMRKLHIKNSVLN